MKTRILFSFVAIIIAGRVTTSAQELSVIQFTNPTLTVGEDQSEVAVSVTRSGNVNASATIDYATRDGAALTGEDYVAASGTLTFAPGESTKSISMTLLKDSRKESLKSFSVALSQPSAGAELGARRP